MDKTEESKKKWTKVKKSKICAIMIPYGVTVGHDQATELN